MSENALEKTSNETQENKEVEIFKFPKETVTQKVSKRLEFFSEEIDSISNLLSKDPEKITTDQGEIEELHKEIDHLRQHIIDLTWLSQENYEYKVEVNKILEKVVFMCHRTEKTISQNLQEISAFLDTVLKRE
jgi:hypothetical protein